MTRPPRRRSGRHALVACLLGVVVTGSTLLVPAPSSADDAPATRTPLSVSLQTLAPAVVPTKGSVVLTGLVTNRSKQTWTDLKAYLFTSLSPLTSRAALADAAATSPDAAVGSRLTSTGLYDEIGDLAPGQTTSYRVSVPRRSLGISGQPGVYWIGVHVLGAENGGPRDQVADGRARTFIPLLPAHPTPTRLALMMPLEGQVRRGAAGRLLRLPDWQRSFSSDGRMDRLLNLSARATQPITWVVDPAVLDAARSVAEDNPKLDPGPTATATEGGGASPSGSAAPSSGASPSAGASAGTGTDPGDVGKDAERSVEAVAAQAWLDEFRRQAPSHTVTAVPYGALDIAAVLTSAVRRLYGQAVALSETTMAGFGVTGSTAVVAPADGLLPGAALRRVDPSTPVLLHDTALPQAAEPALARRGRAPVVLTDTAAAAGGPGPGPRLDALAMRQRLLAEAALHSMSPQADQPLVASTPTRWNPGADWNDADFFAGLQQQHWLQMVDLPSVVAGADPTPAGAPAYPRSARRAEVPVRNLVSSERLVRTGATYGRLLPDNDTVEGVLSRVAMLGSSENARPNPGLARAQVDGTTGYVRLQMHGVHIEGPEFVMMSGETGPIQVTLVNGLDQTVQVGVTARTSGSLVVSRHDPVTLGPGKRTAMRLEAQSQDIGVHTVTLQVTDPAGHPIGSSAHFSVRTSRVSTVIWVIMAVAGVLLFLAIGVRLVRRVRRRKATHGPRLPREDSGRPGQEIDA